MIGQIVKQWQLFCKIQDGDNRHLEFQQQCISDVIDMFQIEVPMFSLILVTIGRRCSKSKMAEAAIFKSTLPVEPRS